MIITRAPYRISFFGGGSDYPAWFREEGGAVLSTSIDKYCYISCRYLPPFFEVKNRIVWSRIEVTNTINEIVHPVVREGLKYLGFDDSFGFEIQHQGDLPARSGVGSSSSFTVAFLKALTALKGKVIQKHQLALDAIELEQKILRESVGSQDQVAAAHGGLNRITFQRNSEITVEPVTIPKSRILSLESNLMLFYTGTSRTASEIASTVIENLPKKKHALREMMGMVDSALSVLSSEGSLDGFGSLLHENWQLKRELSPMVTTAEVDLIYETATKHGARGGKLLGAGGSGFMLFYVPIEKQASVRRALSKYLYVPFCFENQGVTIVHYGSDFSDRNGYETKALARGPE